jgi:hypothetical protein
MNPESAAEWVAPSNTEVSFSFRRSVGPRLVHGAVTLSFQQSKEFIFISAVTWPEEELDEAVAKAVKEALATGGPNAVAMQVVLKSIEWDEIHSSASGFARAARAATLAALGL